jgi:LysR family transcriptional regulator, cell division regulator
VESGDLKVFYAVAREGSITKAACRLGYVQSNVTARIQNLEQELQTVLFKRSKRGMTLTDAGHKLMAHAEKILYLLDVAHQEMKVDDIPKGSIKLGSIETTAAVHLPSLLLNYRKKYPEVKLSLFTGVTEELAQKIIHFELDGAFVSGPLDGFFVKQIPVFEEEMVFISEPGSDPLIEVLKKPMLFFGVGCYHRDRFESWLTEEMIPIPDIMEFGSLEAIFGGVAAGIGNSILPRSAIKKWKDLGALRVHSLPEKYRHTTVYFIYRQDHFFTAAFKKFIEELKLDRV